MWTEVAGVIRVWKQWTVGNDWEMVWGKNGGTEGWYYGCERYLQVTGKDQAIESETRLACRLAVLKRVPEFCGLQAVRTAVSAERRGGRL